MEDNLVILEKMHEYRARKGISQKKMSVAMGIAEATLINLNKGRWGWKLEQLKKAFTVLELTKAERIEILERLLDDGKQNLKIYCALCESFECKHIKENKL